MIETRLFQMNDRRLHALVSAEAGPPIVLLHGVLRNGRDFAPLFPALAPRWRIVAVDHRGHGGSDRGEAYQVVDYADDVIAMLAEHFVEGAVLYGHSLGAWTAMVAAAALPELIRGVILEDPPGEQLLRRIDQTPFHAMFTQMQSLAGHRLTISEATRRLAAFQVQGPSGAATSLGELRDAVSLRFSAACLRDVDPAVLPPLIEGRWLDGIDVQKSLGEIRCPALLLYGDEAKGGMLSGSEANQWAREMPDACALHVPGGHLLHWLERETVIRHTLGFLETLEPCEAPR